MDIIHVTAGPQAASGGPRAVPVPAPGPPAPAQAAGSAPAPLADRVELTFEGQAPVSDSPQAPPNPTFTRGGTRVRKDEITNRFVFEILNREREVIKQFPPEEALRIAARFREITGLLFDESI